MWWWGTHTAYPTHLEEAMPWYEIGHAIGTVIGGALLVIGAIVDEVRP